MHRDTRAPAIFPLWKKKVLFEMFCFVFTVYYICSKVAFLDLKPILEVPHFSNFV